ncbi:Late secretory pathway protein avl9 [Termitomyces sp. J132]|nr:Late secretory pathway protein avl9 [Termitomyces sp. J132]
MTPVLPEPSPAPVHNTHSFFDHDADDDDADTASQRSIPLSSPAVSQRNSMRYSDAHSAQSHYDDFLKRDSYRVETGFDSEDSSSMSLHSINDTPVSSASASVYDEPKDYDDIPIPTDPPILSKREDRSSMSSSASMSSRKARPESLIVTLKNEPIIHGVALVDFNHLIGPRIEYSKGDIFEDEEVAKILPFLSLPDGAHLSAEDYSYFHVVPSGPDPTTLFGISCNQQIAASALRVKAPDVTRSTVQKAVVVLASKPVFGPIRDKLGVVTTALFNQRDFTDATILDDFAISLEHSLRGQLTESGFYMGTSLREFVHMFRQRTLILVKAMMLQQRIVFYGHPVERLCTYQYSLVSLIPGLLHTLDDCGSPQLAARAPTLERPSSLKTSDPKSMMAFMGLPLDLFGKGSFFQPYLPLQQIDVIKGTASWLCGATNTIVTSQQEVDLLVNIETGAFEFRNPHLERSSALTAVDRKWMDEIIHDVNENWNEENPSTNLQFKGSDDYLRSKFEEYVFAALSVVKYQDFLVKSAANGVMVTNGSGGAPTAHDDFNPVWISEFRKTTAYEVWEKVTDPVIFDIVEPRHPCNEKPSVVADIGLRLSEGIQDLKLEQQLAPAREAVTRAVSVGSANFFKAVGGVRDRWAHRSDSVSTSNMRSNTVEVTDLDSADRNSVRASPSTTSTTPGGFRSFSLLARSSSTGDSTTSPASAPSTTPALSPAPSSSILPTSLTSPSKNLAAWGTGFGSFISQRASTLLARKPSEDGGVMQNSPATNSAPVSTENKPIPAPPPESVTKTRNVPPPVQVQTLELMDGDEDKYGLNSGPQTPQPFKGPSINVTTPDGKTPTRRAFNVRPSTPPLVVNSPSTPKTSPAHKPLPVSKSSPVPKSPPVPRPVTPPRPSFSSPKASPARASPSTPTATPVPFPTPEARVEYVSESPAPDPVTTSPQLRARLTRSNTASRRPTAGLWEDRKDVLDQVPKGLKRMPSSRNPWNDDDDLKRLNETARKSWESGVKANDVSSVDSKRSREDLEHAYSGVAL